MSMITPRGSFFSVLLLLCVALPSAGAADQPWAVFPGDRAAPYDPSAKKLAVKCDLCKSLSGGPACVRACPTGAAQRVSPESLFQRLGGGGPAAG